jgi:hypothetical protein
MSKFAFLCILILTNAATFYVASAFFSSSHFDNEIDGNIELQNASQLSPSTELKQLDEEESSGIVSNKATPTPLESDENIGVSDLIDSERVDGRTPEQLFEDLTTYRRRTFALQADLEKNKTRLQAAHDLLKDAGIAIPDFISLEEVKKHIPEPFAGLVANSSIYITEDFTKLYEAEADFDWGPQMEQRVSDYIVTHQHASAVQLQSVTCRANICEIRGFPIDPALWRDNLLSEMATQPWWDFNSTSSMSGSSTVNGEDTTYFYLLAKKLTTDAD